MNNLIKSWKKFSFQPDIWLFYVFLITLPLSIRKILFFYPLNNEFNEYTGIYLYLSDIILIAVFLLFILDNKLNILSIVKFLSQPLIFLPLFLIIWAFVSIIWSPNQSIALFKSIKLLECFLLYIYVIIRVFSLKNYYILNDMFHVEHLAVFTHKKIWENHRIVIKNIFLIIISIGLINSLIGILQFVLQHSLGFYWLKESIISPDMAGVAKVIFDGHVYIRSYGLLPHPNILAGFLLVSIILTWYLRNLFHVEHQNDRKCSTWNKYVYILSILIQISALILTFSKSGILALMLTWLYIHYKNVPRGTKLIRQFKKMFHVEHFWLILIILIIITGISFLNLKPDINSFFIKSINDRMIFINVSRGTIISNWLLGAGNGQFVLTMDKYYSVFLENWQYQPVHNVFLLIWSELGILGLIPFIWLLWKMFYSSYFSCIKFVPRGTNVTTSTSVKLKENQIIARGILLGLVFIMLFDHYLWDIQQGQFIFWLIIGIVGGYNMWISYLTIDKK